MSEVPLESLRERALHGYEEPTASRTQRAVALLIMLATLGGAVAAVLQAQAKTHEAGANRDAQEASVQTMAAVVEYSRTLGQWQASAAVSARYRRLEAYLRAVVRKGGRGAYAEALANTYERSSTSVARFMNKVMGHSYLDSRGVLEAGRFYEELYRPVYLNQESYKAFARERDGWVSKRSNYIGAITVFALSVFLLGLTLTVPEPSGRPFLYAGCVILGAGLIWTSLIASVRVERPSSDAIKAYVDGQLELDVGFSNGEREPLEDAIRSLGRAISLSDHYEEAYVARGASYLRLDWSEPRGPQGSSRAREDFKTATQLKPDDYVSWGNLGAAEFWLQHYDAALEANEKALKLNPHELVFNMNEALYLLVEGRKQSYRSQLARIGEVLKDVPVWDATTAMQSYKIVFNLGVCYRPRIAAQLRGLRRDLLKLAPSADLSLGGCGA